MQYFAYLPRVQCFVDIFQVLHFVLIFDTIMHNTLQDLNLEKRYCTNSSVRMYHLSLAGFNCQHHCGISTVEMMSSKRRQTCHILVHCLALFDILLKHKQVITFRTRFSLSRFPRRTLKLEGMTRNPEGDYLKLTRSAGQREFSSLK